jgi:hypothetical protein
VTYSPPSPLLTESDRPLLPQVRRPRPMSELLLYLSLPPVGVADEVGYLSERSGR